MKTAKKPAKKVPVKVQPVEQPPAKVVETVNEGLADAKRDIAAESEKPKIHHVKNAGDKE